MEQQEERADLEHPRGGVQHCQEGKLPLSLVWENVCVCPGIERSLVGRHRWCFPCVLPETFAPWALPGETGQDEVWWDTRVLLLPPAALRCWAGAFAPHMGQ